MMLVGGFECVGRGGCVGVKFALFIPSRLLVAPGVGKGVFEFPGCGQTSERAYHTCPALLRWGFTVEMEGG